jgi:Zn finger protein HypA/HybF involved in hydrogenase expression
MALIKCYECKAEISSTAVKCPHCGAANRTVSMMQFIYLAAVVFAVIVAVVMAND